ncbi:MAG: hypothetical protein EAZ42_08705 [Verrucomicrobia bacterium]|nr:MAG: hypothetical protein EAZ42_08705 [Verrucomicrobiota bacterium]
MTHLEDRQKQSHAWYYCEKCGELYQAPFGNPDASLCNFCGVPIDSSDQVSPQLTYKEALPEKKESSSHGGERRKKRKRKKSYLLTKIVVGWTLVIAAITLGAKYMWRGPADEPKNAIAVVMNPLELTAQEEQFLQYNVQGTNECFNRFISSMTPEQSNGYTADSVVTAARMGRFYSHNPRIKIDAIKLKRLESSVVNFPESRGIVSLWQPENGEVFDAAFVKEGDTWLLDWDHYVRYSDYPLNFFRFAEGMVEGEFRLLARERLADENTQNDLINIEFYTPKPSTLNETTGDPLDLVIQRSSAEGKILTEAFARNKQQPIIFGVKLEKMPASEMIRVRVKLQRRENAAGVKSFKLAKVIACHWYSIDHLGFELPTDPAAEK